MLNFHCCITLDFKQRIVSISIYLATTSRNQKPDLFFILDELCQLSSTESLQSSAVLGGDICHNVAGEWLWRTECISALAGVRARLPQTLAVRIERVHGAIEKPLVALFSHQFNSCTTPIPASQAGVRA